ncbi:hypothetical protein DMENIID0001_161710 [Sergentomyia squamirostris]
MLEAEEQFPDRIDEETTLLGRIIRPLIFSGRDFNQMLLIMMDSCEVIEEYEELQQVELDDVSVEEKEIPEETSDLSAGFENDLVSSTTPESQLKLFPLVKWGSGELICRWLVYPEPDSIVFCRPQL